MRRMRAVMVWVVAAAMPWAACDPGPRTGAAVMQIEFRAPERAPGLRGVLSGIVDTIRVTVSDQTGSLVQAAFGYETLSGTVEAIPEGTGRNFLVEALSGQDVAYRGVVLNVTITAGQTAQVPVIMDPAYTVDVYAPAAVDDLAAQPSGFDVQLSWTSVGNDAWVGRAAFYDLRRSANTIQASNFDSATPIAGTPAPAVSGQAETFTVTGLQAGQTYHFALRVRDSGGNASAVSNEAIATTQTGDVVSPNAIVDLAIDAIGQTSVDLSWTASGDDGSTGTAAAYDIRYSLSDIVDNAAFNAATPAANPPVPSAQGSVESLTVTGLTTGLAYFFALRVADEVPNWSALSNVVSATVQDLVPPAAVSLSVSGVQDTAVTLSWNAPGDDGDVGTADHYEIRYADFAIVAGNFDTATLFASPPVPAAAGTAESANLSGLTTLVPYWFALISYDEAGNPSALSNVVQATPGEQDLVPPADVTDLAVDSVTASSVDLSWTAPGDDGASGGPVAAYDVRYSSSDIIDELAFQAATPFAWPGGWAIEDDGLPQTLTVTGLTSDTNYYFALKARDDLNNWSGVSGSAMGSTADDTTPPAAVAVLSVDTLTADSVSLSWTAPGDDGASGGPVSAYDVRYSSSDITDEVTFLAATPFAWPGGLAIEDAGLPQTLTVTGLTSDTTYYFALKAVDEVANWSGVSGSATATTPDITPPADVAVLSVDSVAADTVSLSWTAPGDDGSGGGPVTAYDVRYSASDITDEATFLAATPFAWPGGLAIEAAGLAQTLDVDGLSSDTTYYFALKASDEAGNWSAVSGSASAYTDGTPPAVIGDLATTAGTGLVTLTWNAPGDDGALGTAATYDIRYSESNIFDDATFNAATPVAVPPTPQAAGTPESFDVTGLTPATLYYFAIKTADEAPNWSGLSNVVSDTPN